MEINLKRPDLNQILLCFVLCFSLKEYVHENIPDIKENKSIRDYLLRVEHWAPRGLKVLFGRRCDTE